MLVYSGVDTKNNKTFKIHRIFHLLFWMKYTYVLISVECIDYFGRLKAVGNDTLNGKDSFCFSVGLISGSLMIFVKLDFKRNLTLRDKYAVTKISLKAKFDCTIYI